MIEFHTFTGRVSPPLKSGKQADKWLKSAEREDRLVKIESDIQNTKALLIGTWILVLTIVIYIVSQ